MLEKKDLDSSMSLVCLCVHVCMRVPFYRIHTPTRTANFLLKLLPLLARNIISGYPQSGIPDVFM